jgi:hypothetical protein
VLSQTKVVGHVTVSGLNGLNLCIEKFYSA